VGPARTPTCGRRRAQCLQSAARGRARTSVGTSVGARRASCQRPRSCRIGKLRHTTSGYRQFGHPASRRGDTGNPGAQPRRHGTHDTHDTPHSHNRNPGPGEHPGRSGEHHSRSRAEQPTAE